MGGTSRNADNCITPIKDAEKGLRDPETSRAETECIEGNHQDSLHEKS